MKSPFLTIDTTNPASIQESFSTIANELFNNWSIILGDSILEFLDIEFYYYCRNHPDTYTKEPKDVLLFGNFKVHEWGIDLSLGNESNNYGGILIKKVKIDNKFRKPDFYDIFFLKLFVNYSNQILANTIWIPKTDCNISFIKTNRIVGKSTDPTLTQAQYRYIAMDKGYWTSNTLKNKEDIIRNLDSVDKNIIRSNFPASNNKKGRFDYLLNNNNP